MFAVESGGVLTRSTQILSQVRLAEDYRCSVRAGARPLIIAAQPPSPSSAGAGPSVSEARENFREDRANAITLVTDRVQRQHDSVFCLGFWQNELPSA
jgi:hypothetical protein